jgi:hypothetical protein
MNYRLSPGQTWPGLRPRFFGTERATLWIGTVRQGRLPREGGEAIGQLGSPRAPLTLHACLEALAHLEEQYILTSAGDEWSASDLLAWLITVHPQLLQLLVYAVPPDANGEGAIYEVAQRGHLLPDVPLYRVRWRQGTMPPEEDGSAGRGSS